MLDPAIQFFLDERKEQWLKSKIKGKTTDEEKEEFERQATEKFAWSTWLPDAAKRASQLSLVSHPSKFSHPGARTTSVIATAKGLPDGFLRTGNVIANLDVLGNAAAMDVYKFLSVKIADGETILAHLEKKSTVIKEPLTVSTLPINEIELGLLAIKQNIDATIKTSAKVKQVYFPVKKAGYHLLSILSPSNIVYKLKEHINRMHFSEEAKDAREAKRANKFHNEGFSEIYGLSVIGYGGTKPQNISVLNSQNGGKAYLLPSMPPELSARSIQPPRINFFSDSLWPKAFKDDFQKFHDQLITEMNNIHVRKRRDGIIRNIFYQVANRLWMIRSLDSGWSDFDNYHGLPKFQKIWLDQQYQESRNEDLQWFEPVRSGLSRWFINTYSNLMGSNALALGDDHLKHIKTLIEECEGALL